MRCASSALQTGARLAQVARSGCATGCPPTPLGVGTTGADRWAVENRTGAALAQLHDLAARIERLAPSHRDPFAFHADKSEIVHELRRFAAALEGRDGR